MLIAKEELNNAKVYEVYQSAFMNPEMDTDGEVKVMIDGFKVFAQAMQDRPFFVLRAIFGIKQDASRQQALELCNRLNDKMIMIRCCIPDALPSLALYIDHFTMTEGGISAEEMIAVTRRFMKVIEDGVFQYDTEHIMS
jgi:hypothetical protein